MATRISPPIGGILPKGAALVGRVMAGTDCDFETLAGFVTIPDNVVWAKQRAPSSDATLASARL